jgi:hypothetical protein
MSRKLIDLVRRNEKLQRNRNVSLEDGSNKTKRLRAPKHHLFVVPIFCLLSLPLPLPGFGRFQEKKKIAHPVIQKEVENGLKH